MTDPLRQLSDEGVAIWLDDMSRGRLTTGNLADLIRDRYVVGVTTNPTIFQKAISDSELYDRQLRDLSVRGPTCSSRSRPPQPACRPSRSASPRASASTSR
jgi:transaldolase